MTEQQVKETVGALLVLGHLSIILLVIGLGLLGGLSPDERNRFIGLVAPMLVTYSTPVIKFTIHNRRRRSRRSPRVNARFATTAVLLPSVFLVLVVSLLLLYAYNLAFESVGDFTTTLVAVEVAFGLYIGQFVGSLFEVPASRRATMASESA